MTQPHLVRVREEATAASEACLFPAFSLRDGGESFHLSRVFASRLRNTNAATKLFKMT